MPGRSRYAYRYDEFQQDRKPVSFNQATIIGTDSHFLNIANGQCGNVAVSCWPTPEGVEGGRVWGKLGSTDVAIMPFRTRAETSTPTVRLETFELEIHFTEPDLQGFGPGGFREICHEKGVCPDPAISLVNLPAPEYVAQRSINDTTMQKSWKFRSKEIQDCNGLARAARWTWDANGHEPIILHGGVAFKHLKTPFAIACHVRGRAFTELPGLRIRIRYLFSNEEKTPKWWTMVPQNSNEDLSRSVQQLEAVMQSLNTQSPGVSLVPAVSGMNSTSGHNFTGSTIGGSANVVMGNIYLSRDTASQEQDARLRQMASQMINQIME